MNSVVPDGAGKILRSRFVRRYVIIACRGHVFMAFSIETQTVPIEIDTHGVMRIAGTRVTLDTVVAAFEQGATAEEIAQQYTSLDLADVYSVIGFYLRWRGEILDYLVQRQQQAQVIRKQNEHRFDPHGIRDRLLARLSE